MLRKIVVISPVYNEEKYLLEYYKAIRKNYLGPILFVDDGSTDFSSKILKEICNLDTDCDCIRHSSRRGYGAALITGFNYSLKDKFNIVVTVDVDLQHDPKYLPVFIDKLNEYDVVLGSRYLQIGSCLNIPKDRLIINRYISRVLEIKLNKKFSDPFCGFRGYKTNFLKNANLKENSYGIALEILFEIVRQKVNYVEIPIEAIYHDMNRKFLDGLDNPRNRLLYYLNIIQRKLEEIYEKQNNDNKSTSR